MLQLYAKILFQYPIDKDRHAEAVVKVDALLQTSDGDELAPVCRSLRLYLLKCIERALGKTALRGLLAEKPLCDANWVIAWRNMHDVDFERFVGAALVPKWN